MTTSPRNIPKIHFEVKDLSILDSREELIVIGQNSSGILSNDFSHEVAELYPPVVTFYRRWVDRSPCPELGDFQSVPGLHTKDRVILRPSFYNLLTYKDELPARSKDVEKALQGACEEATNLGFRTMSLHAPSIYHNNPNPVEALRTTLHSLQDDSSVRFMNFRAYKS